MEKPILDVACGGKMFYFDMRIKLFLLMESQQIAFQRVMLFYKINANLMPQFLIAI